MILTTITARTTPGTQAYIIGAQPIALLVWSNGQTGTGLTTGYRFLFGMSDGIDQASRSVAMDEGASPNGVQVDSPGLIYRMASTVAGGSATVIQEAELISFNSTGFMLDWITTDGNATRIQVLAFTEDDVDAAVMRSQYCDANPEVITGIGFAADAVITLGGTNTGTGYALGPFCAMPTFGFSDGVINVSGDSVGRYSSGLTPGCDIDLVNNVSTSIRYISSIFEGFVATGIGIGNIVPDGFDAFEGGFGFAPLVHYFLALSAPNLVVKVGSVQQGANGASVDLDLDFDPTALILIATGDNGTVAGVTSNEAGYAMGGWTVDGTTVHAWSGCARTGGVSETARTNGTGALKFYTAAASPASSALAMDISVGDEGHSLVFDSSDGGARTILYLAIGVPAATEVNRCEGGTVPQVPDPPDGYSPEGLGPHSDRFFIETDLTTAGTQRWAMHEPMNDSPALEVHAGHKQGRIINCGSIIRRSTDRLGAWNAATARWIADDHDRRIRGLMAAEPWFSREFRPYLCDRADVENARCLGRFIIQDHPPSPELLAEIEGLDIINTEFSPFSLDREILSSVVFSRAFFGALPAALADLNPLQPVPVYGGRWSDRASDGEIPVMQGAAWRGASVDGIYWVMGFGDMPEGAPPPPDSVSASAIPGGSINLGDNSHNLMYAQVWAETAGVEGDPEPFVGQSLPITISANGSKVRVEWTFAGTDPDHWRIGLASAYFGARWQQVLQVAGTARAAEFTSIERFGGGGSITPGATAEYMNRGEYVVLAVMADGRTGHSWPTVIMQTGPYARPAHISWIPVDGALSYEIYKAPVPHAYFGFTERFTVPADQIDSDGYAYFSDTWIPGEPITEIEGPKGMLPVWDVGDEILSDGQPWGALVLCRWPVAEIEEVRQGGADITEHDDLLHPDHPNWASYFPTRYVTKNGCDFTILYAKGDILARHRGSLAGNTGTAGSVGASATATDAPVQVNACTTEDVGDGTGFVITIGPRLAQHMLAELIRNDHLTGTWTGIPAFPDGVYEIRTSSYLAAENKEIERVGEGYPSRMAFMGHETVRDFFMWCVQGLGLHHAIDHHGRVRCGHYDDAIDFTATYRTFKDVREITGDIRTIPMTTALENRIPYQADFRPVDMAYALRDVYVEDAAAVIANRGKVKAGPERLTQFAATPTTYNDVLYRALILGRYVRTWVEVPVGIVGLNVDIFEIFQVTDEAGISASGWDGEYVLCLEHEIIPPDPSADRPTLVVLKGLDITGIVEAAFMWAEDDIPATWDLMTDAQRRLYGGWANAAGVIPSLNSPGKEWR